MSISSQHHSFDIRIAAAYGMECAVLIHHFQHWIRINRFAKRNIKEGKCWTYQTRKEIQAHFPYWSFDEVRRLCEKLVEKGVLITGNFNKIKIDKTLWYAFVDEAAFGVDEENSNKFYERQNCPSKGKTALPEGKTATLIPDSINTDSKTEDKEKRKETKEKGVPPPDPLALKREEDFFSNEEVRMPTKDHVRLVEKFGREVIDNYVKQLALYAKMKPRQFNQYKDHAAVIESWILKNDKSQGKAWNNPNNQPKSPNSNPSSSDKGSSELRFLSPDSWKKMLEEFSDGAPDKKDS